MYLRKASSKATRLKDDARDSLAHASHLFVPLSSPVQVPRVIIVRLDSQTTSQGMPKLSMMCCRMAAAATDLWMPALQQVAMTYARSGVLYDAFSSSKCPLNSASHVSKPLESTMDRMKLACSPQCRPGHRSSWNILASTKRSAGCTTLYCRENTLAIDVVRRSSHFCQ